MNEIIPVYSMSSSFIFGLKEFGFIQWLILKSLIFDILNLVPTERGMSESGNGPLKEVSFSPVPSSRGMLKFMAEMS